MQRKSDRALCAAYDQGGAGYSLSKVRSSVLRIYEEIDPLTLRICS